MKSSKMLEYRWKSDNGYVADVSRNPCALNLFRGYSGFVPVDPKVWDRLLHDHAGGENVFRLLSPLAGDTQAVYASCWPYNADDSWGKLFWNTLYNDANTWNIPEWAFGFASQVSLHFWFSLHTCKISFFHQWLHLCHVVYFSICDLRSQALVEL